MGGQEQQRQQDMTGGIKIVTEANLGTYVTNGTPTTSTFTPSSGPRGPGPPPCRSWAAPARALPTSSPCRRGPGPGTKSSNGGFEATEYYICEYIYYHQMSYKMPCTAFSNQSI